MTKSPCVNICVIDPVSTHCIGCGRTRDEIASWVKLTDKERDEVFRVLPDRLNAITKERKRGATRRSPRKMREKQ